MNRGLRIGSGSRLGGLGAFGIRGGGSAPLVPLQLTSNANGTVTLSWAFSNADVMTVDWGDGSAATSHATTLNHTYSSGANKTISFTCPDWTKVTSMNVGQFGGAYAFRVSQPFPDLSLLTNLATWSSSAQFFTDIPATLSANTKLTSFVYATGAETSISNTAFSTQKNLATVTIDFYSMPTNAGIDNLLHGLVTSLGISGRVTATINTAGGMYAAPAITPFCSETGATDAATLISAGWTVNNVAHPWFAVIGDSISQANAAWVNSVKAAWNGGSGVGVNALRDFAIASQGIIAGNAQDNMQKQVERCSGAQLIICFMGTVDDDAGNMTTLQSTLETNLSNLKSQNPSSNIYFVNVLPRWTDNTTGPEVPKGNIRGAIAAGCAAQSITCWDTYSTPWILQSDTSDGLHPTAGGQTKIGNAIKTLLGFFAYFSRLIPLALASASNK